MAWDWIKIETATPDKAEICGIADILDIDIDAAFGKVFRVWAWFDQYTTDGNAPTVTKRLLDRIVCVTGFCDVMVKVGWMVEEGENIALTNFDRHNGKTTKTRILTAKRVSDYRNKEDKCNGDSVTNLLHERGQEQEQEQEQEQKKKTINISLPPTSGTAPNCPHLEIVSLYNSILSGNLTAIKPSLWNGSRKTNLQGRWKEDKERQNVEWWREYFESVLEYPFLLGENDRNWRADMEWLITPKNMTKVLEGKYKKSKKGGHNGNTEQRDAELEKLLNSNENSGDAFQH